jgi:hypothetical protein
MSSKTRRFINPGEIATRLFPGREAVDYQCRKAVFEIVAGRQWHDLAGIELDSLEETVWRDLREIQKPNEDFDGFSARSAEFSAENSQKFSLRAARHLSGAREAIQAAHCERELSILAELAVCRRRK